MLGIADIVDIKDIGRIGDIGDIGDIGYNTHCNLTLTYMDAHRVHMSPSPSPSRYGRPPCIHLEGEGTMGLGLREGEGDMCTRWASM
jgi:hypothetical protein